MFHTKTPEKLSALIMALSISGMILTILPLWIFINYPGINLLPLYIPLIVFGIIFLSSFVLPSLITKKSLQKKLTTSLTALEILTYLCIITVTAFLTVHINIVSEHGWLMPSLIIAFAMLIHAYLPEKSFINQTIVIWVDIIFIVTAVMMLRLTWEKELYTKIGTFFVIIGIIGISAISWTEHWKPYIKQFKK